MQSTDKYYKSIKWAGYPFGSGGDCGKSWDACSPLQGTTHLSCSGRVGPLVSGLLILLKNPNWDFYGKYFGNIMANIFMENISIKNKHSVVHTGILASNVCLAGVRVSLVYLIFSLKCF